MAQVVAVIASTHHPFYYRASTAVGEERPPFADEWVAKIERFRETLTRARPDVLVMVGSDHPVVTLERCAGCAIQGWGWADTAYWLAQPTTLIFSTRFGVGRNHPDDASRSARSMISINALRDHSMRGLVGAGT